MKKKIFFLLSFFFSCNIYAQWAELGGVNSFPSPGYSIYSSCVDVTGNVYMAGNFKNANGKYYVAKFDGNTWSELGGINALAANGPINSICSDAVGNIYATGLFSNAGGHFYIAKYNGSGWSQLSTDFIYGGNGNSIYADLSGNIYAEALSPTYTYVAKYNGTNWSEAGGTGSFIANNAVYSICSDAMGNIYAAGGFTNGSGKYYVAKFDGNNWSELGGTNSFAANGNIKSIFSDAAGHIYAAGGFRNTSNNYYVAKFDGSTWTELGGTNSFAANGGIYSICKDGTGNIYAAGFFTNTNNNTYIAKYNGSTWTELGGPNSLSSILWILYHHTAIYSICADATGNIYAAGDLINTDNNRFVAKYTNTVLPLTLINFTAQYNEKNISLNWHSVNEMNTAYFNIQRSNDGLNFTGIYKKQASGKQDAFYGLIDNNIPQNTKIIYYRLQCVDKDGSFTYSKVVSVKQGNSDINFSVYPNPTSNSLYIKGNNLKMITIINSKGEVVLQRKLAQGNYAPVNIDFLAAGPYFVQLKDYENEIHTERLIIKK